jgi:hypothetical protein
VTLVKNIDAVDLLSLTSRTVTDEGFLVAPGTMARVGTQDYLASELGLDKTMGLPPGKRLTLYRPHEEVGNPESVKSFNTKPIGAILSGPRRGKHPEGNRVTKDNWSDVAVGDVHDVKMNGDLMQGTLIIRDKDAVDAVQKGMSALSNGYQFDLDLTPGQLSDGTKYDGIQRNIRGNHLMIVDVGRGGYVCRIGDRQQENTMTKTIKIGDSEITFEGEGAAATAELVKKIVGDRDVQIVAITADRDGLQKKLATADSALAQAVENSKKVETDLKGKIAELEKKQVTDAQIEALAIERVKVVGDAKLLVPDFKDEGKGIPAIRAEVLKAVSASDEALKTVITAVLGDAEPGKDEQDTRRAFAAVVASRGIKKETGGLSPERKDATARALAGGDSKETVEEKPVGRAAMMANLHTQSRKTSAETAA